MARMDPHSYADDTQPRTRHLRWKARVDFESNTMEAEAVLELESPGTGPLDLDTKALTIQSVDSHSGPIPFEMAPEEKILGQRLRLNLPPRPLSSDSCCQQRELPGEIGEAGG